jgi:hypothetical protein
VTTDEEFTFEEPPLLARQREAERQQRAAAERLDRFLSVLRERSGEWALIPDDLVDLLRRTTGPGRRSDVPTSVGRREAVVETDAVGAMRLDVVCDRRDPGPGDEQEELIYHGRHLFDIPPYEGAQAQSTEGSPAPLDGA